LNPKRTSTSYSIQMYVSDNTCVWVYNQQSMVLLIFIISCVHICFISLIVYIIESEFLFQYFIDCEFMSVKYLFRKQIGTRFTCY